MAPCERHAYGMACATITKRFYHRHYAGGRLQQLAISAQILGHGAQIDLHDSIVDIFGQQPVDLFEFKDACTLYQDGLVPEMQLMKMCAKGFHGAQIETFAGEPLAEYAGLRSDASADGDEAVSIFLFERPGHFGIQLSIRCPAFKDIRKNDGSPAMLLLLGKKIQGDGQRAEIGAIAIVDDGAVIDAAF